MTAQTVLILTSPVLRSIGGVWSWMARRAPGKSRLFAVRTWMRRISPRSSRCRGCCLQRNLLPGKGFDLLVELLVKLLLVPFHDHDVLRVSAEQVAGVLALGVHGVAGHDHVRRIGKGLRQRLEAGGFVGLYANVEFGQDQASEAVAGCEYMNPAAHRPVQRVAVDAAQQPTHRRLRRQAPIRERRIGPYAETLQGRTTGRR
ncbi:hypothetical protein AADR41_13450 [Streptomyces sp. CLV115]|uniref:hypothetical protein n=1 Tax=Streptomyces sp. CLV115 TaxID=3138502 RepID=UPI00313C980C